MRRVFRYRRRDSSEQLDAVVGATVFLDERVEYLLVFDAVVTSAERSRFIEIGGELLDSVTGLVSFRNFVGTTEIAGVSVEVTSTKVGPEGVSLVLEEVSKLAAGLLFGWRTPTTFGAGAATISRSPVPYHQLQFLRRAVLAEPSGKRLQDFIGAIERNPTRRFESDRPMVKPSNVRRLDHKTLSTVFSRLDRLAPVAPGSTISDHPLAIALTFGVPPRPHFPAQLSVPRGRLSFDTAENRFVKHVLGECLALVYRFADHPKLHLSLRSDCRLMQSILETTLSMPFLAEAGQIRGFQSPSQALLKADGYRQMLSFWSRLTSYVSLPGSQTETTRLLEGRDMATLYEYWVFVKVLEATVEVTGSVACDRIQIRRDEMGETLMVGLAAGIGPDVSVNFNQTFCRSSGSGYSTPLRPDVVLCVGDAQHAFDAKYRLDRFDSEEDDPDDGPATYKRADLYKMHTYRDAILGLRTAFVVYPGTEFVFFARTGTKHHDPLTMTIIDGVGAVPLRPRDTDPSRKMREVLTVLLNLRSRP